MDCCCKREREGCQKKKRMTRSRKNNDEEQGGGGEREETRERDAIVDEGEPSKRDDPCQHTGFFSAPFAKRIMLEETTAMIPQAYQGKVDYAHNYNFARQGD